MNWLFVGKRTFGRELGAWWSEWSEGCLLGVLLFLFISIVAQSMDSYHEKQFSGNKQNRHFFTHFLLLLCCEERIFLDQHEYISVYYSTLDIFLCCIVNSAISGC